ncbi:MFS transporter [Streptomyces colonosanans]|uniref:MFS transporter n=1 Tax=Streptomyces colonosanans TaxID=1428652 RepID=A0A1S2NZP1_9ACTN|nr:MFS transporter [Streptomyces colonosanans]OIJ86695.1 MFS transporter [Streptomyces colonosanans]
MTEHTTHSGAVAGAEPEGPPPSLWRNRDFLVFWAGEAFSLYGTQVTNLALPLTAVLVFEVGAEQLGLLRFAQLVPFLGLALVFGVWVDRIRKRPVMLGANLARMVLIGLVPVLYHFDLLTLPLLYALALGVGVASVLFDVSWMSYVPVLVKDRRSLLEANTKLNATLSSADIAGPGVAGTLVSAFSAPFAMTANAFTYAASVLSLIAIRTPEPTPKAPRSRRHLRAELAEGLRWVFGNRWLRAIGLVGCSCNFLLTMVQSLFLLYAVRDRELSAAAVGFIMGAAAVGGLLGALVSGMVVRRLSVGTTYRVSVSIIFLGPLLIPAAAGPRWLVVVLFVASFFMEYFGSSVSNVLIVSLRQTITPQHLMGRMTAAMRMLLYGGGALGGPVGGLLAAVAGLHGALWIAGLISAVMLIPIILSPVGKLRDMPTGPEDSMVTSR